jgi:hypothetical protein
MDHSLLLFISASMHIEMRHITAIALPTSDLKPDHSLSLLSVPNDLSSDLCSDGLFGISCVFEQVPSLFELHYKLLLGDLCLILRTASD